MGQDIDKLIAEVERLDHEEPKGWHPHQSISGRWSVRAADDTTVADLRADHTDDGWAECLSVLIALYRMAAPTLAAEVKRLRAGGCARDQRTTQFCAEVVQRDAEIVRLRAALTFADQQGAEAIERVSTAIVNDKWNATAAFQARALKAEKERDTLHDRIEGALAAALGNPVMSIHDGDGPVADSLESLIALVASEHASVARIRAERDKLHRMVDAMDGSPWFVVHQRDGRPQLDVFSGDGAEHAAKMRARDHATNWSEVYIMQGQRVRGGDFEDEAMKDRSDRSKPCE